MRCTALAGRECLAIHSTRRATQGHAIGLILLAGNLLCHPARRGRGHSLLPPPNMISSHDGTEDRLFFFGGACARGLVGHRVCRPGRRRTASSATSAVGSRSGLAPGPASRWSSEVGSSPTAPPCDPVGVRGVGAGFGAGPRSGWRVRRQPLRHSAGLVGGSGRGRGPARWRRRREGARPGRAPSSVAGPGSTGHRARSTACPRVAKLAGQDAGLVVLRDHVAAGQVVAELRGAVAPADRCSWPPGPSGRRRGARRPTRRPRRARCGRRRRAPPPRPGSGRPRRTPRTGGVPRRAARSGRRGPARPGRAWRSP